MNKDVIYIDVDDDITAIIGKVKDSKEKIVALVPPKRIGALQSAVNLRLLQRAATTDKKHLVLITNNKALMALAASAKLPVAKNAQSKPEVPEIAALEVDDGEDIINGDELPVGDHARQGAKDTESATDKAAASVIAANAADSSSRTRPTAKKGAKVPNFNTFRKKLVIGGALGVLLVGFLVWAIFFAPRATVVITAKTSDANIGKTVTLQTDNAATTSFKNSTIKALRQEQKKQQSVDFTATGKKDAGEKATGSVKFATNSISNLGTTIPAGTELASSSGLVFVTNQSVTMTISNYSGATVGVTAAENGDKYNAASGSLSGAPSGISASFTGPTGGGVSRMVTIVTAEDVQKASQSLADQDNSGDAAKKALQAAFDSDVAVIDTSFATANAAPVSSPKVGEEATSAKLTSEVTYSMYGVAKGELDRFLDEAVKESIADQDDQKVYENGSSKAAFTDFATQDTTTTVSLAATGKVGPKIDDNDIKDTVKGKRFGDIQADIEAIQGVDNVDVKFFPFWVRTVPNNPEKITIEFKVDGE